MSLNCRYHAMISVKNLPSHKCGYCKHLFKFDRSLESVISDYDTCIYARVDVPSTNHNLGASCDIS